MEGAPFPPSPVMERLALRAEEHLRTAEPAMAMRLITSALRRDPTNERVRHVAVKVGTAARCMGALRLLAEEATLEVLLTSPFPLRRKRSTQRDVFARLPEDVVFHMARFMPFSTRRAFACCFRCARKVQRALPVHLGVDMKFEDALSVVRMRLSPVTLTETLNIPEREVSVETILSMRLVGVPYVDVCDDVRFATLVGVACADSPFLLHTRGRRVSLLEMRTSSNPQLPVSLPLQAACLGALSTNESLEWRWWAEQFQDSSRMLHLAKGAARRTRV